MTHPHGERATGATEKPKVSPEQAAKNVTDLKEWAYETFDSDDYFMYRDGVLGLEDTLNICMDYIGFMGLQTAKGMLQGMYAEALGKFESKVAGASGTFDAESPDFLEARENGNAMLLGRRQKLLAEQAIDIDLVQ